MEIARPRKRRCRQPDLAHAGEHPQEMLQSACPALPPDKVAPPAGARGTAAAPGRGHVAPRQQSASRHVAGTQQCCAPMNSTTTSPTT
jgi:hypothetical protein